MATRSDHFTRIYNNCTRGTAGPSLIYTDLYTYLFYAQYRGYRGPMTFSGKPREVVEKFRRWQKGCMFAPWG